MIVFDAFLFHEGLNLRIAGPLLAFILIAADVHIGVRKKRGHLAQKTIKKFVGLLAGRIESRLKNSRASFNLVRAGSAAHLRITNQPARAVAGNIKLRHYANAAVTSVSDNLAHLVLGVEKTI